MSFNMVGERIFTYDNAELLINGEDGLSTLPINLIPVNSIDPGSSVRHIKVETDDSALLLSIEETTADRYHDASGHEANWVRRMIPRGYVSVAYDPDTNQNTFRRAEMMVASPDLLTPHALSCLGLIRARQESISRMDALAVHELLRMTAGDSRQPKTA